MTEEIEEMLDNELFNEVTSSYLEAKKSVDESKRKKYKYMNKYKCTKCGKDFEIKHYVDNESAVCNECFKRIIEAKTVKEYLKSK